MNRDSPTESRLISVLKHNVIIVLCAFSSKTLNQSAATQERAKKKKTINVLGGKYKNNTSMWCFWVKCWLVIILWLDWSTLNPPQTVLFGCTTISTQPHANLWAWVGLVILKNRFQHQLKPKDWQHYDRLQCGEGWRRSRGQILRFFFFLDSLAVAKDANKQTHKRLDVQAWRPLNHLHPHNFQWALTQKCRPSGGREDVCN